MDKEKIRENCCVCFGGRGGGILRSIEIEMLVHCLF